METWTIFMMGLLVALTPLSSAVAQTQPTVPQEDHPSSAIEQNKHVILRFFREVLNQRNPSLIDELYVSDVVDHTAFPDQEPGTAGIKNAVRYFLDTFADLEVTIEDLIAENDKVVTRETWSGTHGPSGKAVTGSVMHIFRLSDGKVTDEWSLGWDWLVTLETQAE